MYQNQSEIIPYVVIAATSHGSVLRNCGHTRIVAGYGMSQ